MYVCDIRPSAATHLGHAFTYAAADVLIRYLEDQGYRARYVQNLTDVDHAILRAAHRGGKTGMSRATAGRRISATTCSASIYDRPTCFPGPPT
jgi:cysteinyl-tRNA synthetase